MRFFVCVILTCLLFACSDLHLSEQLSRVDHLQKNVDSLIIVLNQVNDSKLKNDIEQNDFLLKELTTLAAMDTIAEAEARLIDTLANLSNQLSTLKEQLKFIKANLSEQLKTNLALEDDIKNGFGKRDKYDQNLSFEENKLKRLESQLNDIKTKKVKTIIKIAVLNSKIWDLKVRLQLKHKQT
jgi:hypothetical protein